MLTHLVAILLPHPARDGQELLHRYQPWIDYLDFVLTFGSQSEVHNLKAQFGLEGVEHNDDFAVYVI
jgi:hypothetical protein